MYACFKFRDGDMDAVVMGCFAVEGLISAQSQGVEFAKVEGAPEPAEKPAGGRWRKNARGGAGRGGRGGAVRVKKKTWTRVIGS